MTSPRVHVEIRTSGHSAAITLEETEVALVGRDPDPSVASPDRAPRLVTLASPNVSANHVEIEHHGDEVSLVDLGSRNGTWLRLPSHTSLRIAAPVQGLSLHVAPGFDTAIDADMPEDACWTSALDYPVVLESAITEWLARRGLPVRARTVPSSAARPNRPGSLPLMTGQDLVIEPVATMDSSWLHLLASIERYVARQNIVFESEQAMREDGLIIVSPAMRRVVAKVIDAAANGARALSITGPSGSGKEGLARCFHRYTARPGAFVARNCAMFTKDLVRTELFGAERGAFTGSVQRLVGAVEMANTGTLFLDELGELPREIQPMLLRFLDHGEYERIGSPGSLRADVRIVCATNRDLRVAALAGEFRTDLWFRLSVHVVEVPPLKERLPDLVAFLKSKPRADASLYDAFSPGALELVEAHEWAGNFRELVSFCERLRLAMPRGPISADVARATLAEGSLVPPGPSATSTPLETTSLVTQIERAAEAFAVDHHTAPRTWDQVKDFVENYWKPVMFAELSSTGHLSELSATALREAAERVRSDRGTAVKQLRRYIDRFGAPR